MVGQEMLFGAVLLAAEPQSQQTTNGQFKETVISLSVASAHGSYWRKADID
jgi:hypothetical protein